MTDITGNIFATYSLYDHDIDKELKAWRANPTDHLVNRETNKQSSQVSREIERDNIYMTKYSIPLVIREKQIKTSFQFYLFPIRMITTERRSNKSQHVIETFLCQWWYSKLTQSWWRLALHSSKAKCAMTGWSCNANPGYVAEVSSLESCCICVFILFPSLQQSIESD